MAHLNDLQSKRKTKEEQGEEFGERKTSIVGCHATLLVHCMTAQMTTAGAHESTFARIFLFLERHEFLGSAHTL